MLKRKGEEGADKSIPAYTTEILNWVFYVGFNWLFDYLKRRVLEPELLTYRKQSRVCFLNSQRGSQNKNKHFKRITQYVDIIIYILLYLTSGEPTTSFICFFFTITNLPAVHKGWISRNSFFS